MNNAPFSLLLLSNCYLFCDSVFPSKSCSQNSWSLSLLSTWFFCSHFSQANPQTKCIQDLWSADAALTPPHQNSFFLQHRFSTTPSSFCDPPNTWPSFLPSRQLHSTLAEINACFQNEKKFNRNNFKAGHFSKWLGDTKPAPWVTLLIHVHHTGFLLK